MYGPCRACSGPVLALSVHRSVADAICLRSTASPRFRSFRPPVNPSLGTVMHIGSIAPMTRILLRLVYLLCTAIIAACGQPALEQLPDYGEALPPSATFVSARNLVSRGLLWLSNSPSGIQFSTAVPGALAIQPVVTILVHGYNTPPRRVGSYFEGLISQLKEDAHYSPSLVVYDRPSIARHWEELSFDEQSAFIEFLSSTVGERSGGRVPGLPPRIRWENNQYAFDRVNASGSAVDGLIALVQRLVDVNPRMTIMIVAHSMGSHVVVEALTRRAKDLSPVRRVILMAPDIDAAALQGAAFHSLSSLEALHVFYSANDEIVGLYSRVANLGFPRFGATGPADVNKLPSYAVMHDVTAALGVSDVHNRYVTRDGAAVINLGKMLEYP
jgi:pimeloyl-ACP methyl ester carboxylesterase